MAQIKMVETTSTGTESEFVKDPKTTKLLNKTTALQLMRERHAEFPDSIHEVIGAKGQLIERLTPDKDPNAAGEVETAEGEASAKKARRPSEYKVKFTNIDPTVRSKWIGAGKKTIEDGYVVFEKWDAAYYACIDVKNAMKALGWKSRGNYTTAMWSFTKIASAATPARNGRPAIPAQDAQTASAFFETHWNKLTQSPEDDVVAEPAAPDPVVVAEKQKAGSDRARKSMGRKTKGVSDVERLAMEEAAKNADLAALENEALEGASPAEHEITSDDPLGADVGDLDDEIVNGPSDYELARIAADEAHLAKL